MGEHTEVTRRELQQLLNVPSYPPALMLMHSTFSLVIVHTSTQSQPLFRSHPLSSTQGYCSRNSHSIIHQLFSPLYWIIPVVYKYVLISPTSKFKIKHFLLQLPPFSSSLFLQNSEVTFFNFPPPILSWTHSNRVSPNLSIKIAFLKVINAFHWPLAQSNGHLRSSCNQPINT